MQRDLTPMTSRAPIPARGRDKRDEQPPLAPRTQRAPETKEKIQKPCRDKAMIPSTTCKPTKNLSTRVWDIYTYSLPNVHSEHSNLPIEPPHICTTSCGGRGSALSSTNHKHYRPKRYQPASSRLRFSPTFVKERWVILWQHTPLTQARRTKVTTMG